MCEKLNCEVIFWQWWAEYPCVQSRSFLFRAWPTDDLTEGDSIDAVFLGGSQ